jgi:hypothetical protein
VLLFRGHNLGSDLQYPCNQLCLRPEPGTRMESIVVTCASTDDTAAIAAKSLTRQTARLADMRGDAGVPSLLHRKNYSSPGAIVPLCACMHCVTALAPTVPGSLHSPVVSFRAASSLALSYSLATHVGTSATQHAHNSQDRSQQPPLLYTSLCALSVAAHHGRRNKKRSSLTRCSRELIHSLVFTTLGNGYALLLPHTTAALYFKAGHNQRLVSMFNNSVVMGSTSTMASEEIWRRYIGQQLMLLTELMVFCVPNYYADHSVYPRLGKGKGRGRSAMDRHKHFVNVQAHVDTAAARSMALQCARLARACDVHYDVEDTEVVVAVSGLRLPEQRDEMASFMLRNTSLTPKGTQFQNAYLLYKHLSTDYRVYPHKQVP